MIQTVEAIVDASGRVRLLGELRVGGPRCAFVTVLDEPAAVPGEPAAWPRRRSRRTGPVLRRTPRGPTFSRRSSVGSVSLLGPVAIQSAAGRLPGRRWPRGLGAVPGYEQCVRRPARQPLVTADFASGGLLVPSVARPGKLFTAHAGLLFRSVGVLTPAAFTRVLSAVLAVPWTATSGSTVASRLYTSIFSSRQTQAAARSARWDGTTQAGSRSEIYYHDRPTTRSRWRCSPKYGRYRRTCGSVSSWPTLGSWPMPTSARVSVISRTTK